MTEHRTRYAAVMAAAATLIKAVEAEEAARVALPTAAVSLPALPDALHALADPFGDLADWLAGLEAEVGPAPASLRRTRLATLAIDLAVDQLRARRPAARRTR